MDQIPLAEMLVALRKELLKAQQRATEEKLQFKLEDIEIELKVGTTKKGAAKGGVKFWVVDVGGEGSKEVQNLQTVKFKMKPLAEGGKPLLVDDEDTL